MGALLEGGESKSGRRSGRKSGRGIGREWERVWEMECERDMEGEGVVVEGGREIMSEIGRGIAMWRE